jgi:hypothetical protein
MRVLSFEKNQIFCSIKVIVFKLSFLSLAYKNFHIFHLKLDFGESFHLFKVSNWFILLFTKWKIHLSNRLLIYFPQKLTKLKICTLLSNYLNSQTHFSPISAYFCLYLNFPAKRNEIAIDLGFGYYDNRNFLSFVYILPNF